MKRRTIWLVLALTLTLIVIAGACSSTPEPAEPESIARGGAMYDKWWKVADGASEPTSDQALWSTQSLNSRSGSTTWRCKECHGWDYQGADGAYASGSHKTGFAGVLDAGDSNSAAELVAILKGGDNADHDFSSVLSDAALEDLANFINEGLIDDKPHINYSTKKVVGANLSNGQSLYDGTCAACHGANGLTIDIEGAGVSTIANGNPWETLHKIRFGHPGTAMPATYLLGWSVQDQVDVLGYAQTLPEVDPASVARGGAMYDKWWKVATGASEPTAD
ncbi:MAG: cytochrome c, partial [Dehalococcoidales bacterium]